MHERRWHNSWPVGEISAEKSNVSKIDFKMNNNDYHWIIEPDIKMFINNKNNME